MKRMEDFLPKPKAPKKLLSGIMVRPPKDICEKIFALAEMHHVSANAIVLAILKKEFEK